ncbi:type VI secretion system tube protein TssD [Chitinophaga varians]|uniref:type VI secretion system tube protein TssD n=1 Tax=Chitinophaga varians TaxID=2202339 RepID=UPI00165F9EE6|nr:type VI secretion system tube protein TssD [Chitinophaga varians]MBC9913526.1 hypothetical protein [Chitinophaga varians]
MSFKATLSLEGSTMNVLECHFTFSQATDETGKPSHRPRGGIIRIVIESDGSSWLFDWMISNTGVKSGTVTFWRRDVMSRMKELRFTDAYCVRYGEHFNASGAIPMQVQLKLSARELALNQSVYQNPWPHS